MCSCMNMLILLYFRIDAIKLLLYNAAFFNYYISIVNTTDNDFFFNDIDFITHNYNLKI